MASFLAPAGRWRRWQGFMIVVTLVICTLCMNIWMYQLKSSNCCSALRLILDSGPDGGACPPVGPCRGFVGNCAEITAQFSDLPVLPDWPTGLADYECHAFPDDARFGDTILVGLLSCAAALPVTIFIFICFDLANDNEPPDSYLRWPLAWPVLVWGLNAHRRWHYTPSLPIPACGACAVVPEAEILSLIRIFIVGMWSSKRSRRRLLLATTLR